MAFLTSVENRSDVKNLVIQDLRELGIKVPKKSKKNGQQDSRDGSSGVFGSALSTLPCVETDDCHQVPRFLTDAFACIRKKVEAEGLFRKNGSLARQKLLKDSVDRGESVQDSHVFDVTSLVKRFFRELPECLFTTFLYDSFIQAGGLENEDARSKSLLSLCLLLPKENLSSLRFTMISLANVAEYSEMNKMDSSNLAVVLTPNILRAEKNDNCQLQTQTKIVEFFIKNSQQIGIVSDELGERAQMMSSCFVSCDEADGLNDSRPKKNKKRRSGSLQGLVSNIKDSLVKWRKTGSRQSLTSDSMMSTQDDNMSTMDVDLTGGFVDATPKVMRKRKADDEMAPFSATKRKAILQQIGTPYTPASVMRSVKKSAPVRKFEEIPSIDFSHDSSVPVFVGSPGAKKLASPMKKKRGDTPKQSPAKKPKRRSLLRRLSGGSKNTSQMYTIKCSVKRSPPTHQSSKKAQSSWVETSDHQKKSHPTEGSPVIGSRLAGDKPTTMESEKKRSIFRRHKKHPSSPARIIGPNMAKNDSNSSFANNIPLNSSTSSRDNYIVMENTTSVNDNNMSDLELARRLQQDLMCASPAVKVSGAPAIPDIKTYRPSRPHQRALSADRAALKRGQPNTIQNGLGEKRCQLPSPMQLRSHDRAPSPVLLRKGSFRKCDISLPVSVQLPENHRTLKDSPSIIQAGAEAKIQLQNLRTRKLNCSLDTAKTPIDAPGVKHTDKSSFSSAYSAEAPMIEVLTTKDLPSQMSDEQNDDVFKVPASMDKTPDESVAENMDISLNSTGSSNASIITVIDRYGPVSNIPRTSSRLSTYAQKIPSNEPESCEKMELDADNISSIEGSSHPHILQHQKSIESVDSGIGSLAGSTVNIHVDSSTHTVRTRPGDVSKKSVSFENLKSAEQVTKPVRRAQSMYERRQDHHVVHMDAPSQYRLLSTDNKIYEDMVMQSSESTEVVEAQESQKLHLPGDIISPVKPVHESVVNLHEVKKVSSNVQAFAPSQHSLTQKPVHESVLNLHDVAKVSSNVEVFSQMQDREDAQCLAEKRASPHRFHNSVTRQRASPVRVPTIFARTDIEAKKFRELARNAIRKGSLSRKPNIPIGTDLLKSKSVESALVRLQKEQETERIESKVEHETHAPEIFKKSLEQARVRRLSKSHSGESFDGTICDVMVSPDLLGVQQQEQHRESRILEDDESTESKRQEQHNDVIDSAYCKAETSEDSVAQNKALSSLQHEMLNVLLKKDVDIGQIENTPTSLQDTIDLVCTPLSGKVVDQSDRITKTPSRVLSASNIRTPSTEENLSSGQEATPAGGKVVRKRRRRSAPVSQYMSREREVDMSEIRKSLMPVDNAAKNLTTMSSALEVPSTPKPQNQPFLEFYDQLMSISQPATPRQDSRQPLKDCNSELTSTNPQQKPAMATPVIKAGLITRDLTSLRTPGGFTPHSIRSSRMQRQTPSGNRYRSPVKPVKRLNSPGSPRSPRHMRSPRKYPSSPIKPKITANKTDLSPIPSHVRDDFEMY